MGHGASDVVSDAEAARSELCVLRCPTAGTRKRRGILQDRLFLENGTKLLVSRNLAEDAEAYPSSEHDPEPSWGMIPYRRCWSAANQDRVYGSRNHQW